MILTSCHKMSPETDFEVDISKKQIETQVDTEPIASQTEVTDSDNFPKIMSFDDFSYSQDDFDNFFENSLFVGDSLILMLDTYKKLPRDAVFAYVGMSIMNIEEKIIPADQNYCFYRNKSVYDAVLEKKPDRLFLMLGSNDLTDVDDEKIENLIENYLEIINNINNFFKENSLNTNIYLISLTPVSPEKEIYNSENNQFPKKNSDIDKFNYLLMLKIVKDKIPVEFINVNSLFRSDDGTLNPDFSEKDGYHFVPDAYNLFLDYIYFNSFLID